MRKGNSDLTGSDAVATSTVPVAVETQPGVNIDERE